MVSVYSTGNAWVCKGSTGVGYYNSLVEVMDAAYATENRAAVNPSLSARRNNACQYCRFTAGS
jgi:hypothetical protein